MIVIAVVNTKGGVGKSTLTSALAVRATREAKRVAIVDLDPQKSLDGWRIRRGGKDSDSPEIMRGVDSALEAVERAAMTGWDFLFLDGPPAFIETVQEMMEAADLSVVPVKGSVVDVLATQDVVAVARKLGAAFVCVFNDVTPPRNKKPDHYAQVARGFLFSHDIPVAKTQISHRISHVKGMNLGRSAAEVGDEAAETEIDNLWLEIKQLAAAAKKAMEGADV